MPMGRRRRERRKRRWHEVLGRMKLSRPPAGIIPLGSHLSSFGTSLGRDESALWGSFIVAARPHMP